MFVKYLADAKDFAKGYLFGHFRHKGLIRGPTVLPLFTGVKPEEAHIRTYSAILGCAAKDILLADRLFSNDPDEREAYIGAAIRQAGNSATIFTDPDTGIIDRLWSSKNQKYECNQNYISYHELHRLLETEEDRLLVVYDESYGRASQEVVSRAMTAKLKELRREGIVGFGYYGNAVNLVFLATRQGAQRLGQVNAALMALLDSRSDRIIPWPEST